MKTGKLLKIMFTVTFILTVSCLYGTIPVHADDYHFAENAEISADELAFIQGTMPGDFNTIFLDGHTITVNGDPTVTKSIKTGDGGKLIVKGNYIQSENSLSLDNNACLEVSGNISFVDKGYLGGSAESSEAYVGGDFLYTSTSNTPVYVLGNNPYNNKGMWYLDGSIIQRDGSGNLGFNNVLLNGTGDHKISLKSNSYIKNLRNTNDEKATVIDGYLNNTKLDCKMVLKPETGAVFKGITTDCYDIVIDGDMNIENGITLLDGSNLEVKNDMTVKSGWLATRENSSLIVGKNITFEETGCPNVTAEKSVITIGGSVLYSSSSNTGENKAKWIVGGNILHENPVETVGYIEFHNLNLTADHPRLTIQSNSKIYSLTVENNTQDIFLNGYLNYTKFNSDIYINPTDYSKFRELTLNGHIITINGNMIIEEGALLISDNSMLNVNGDFEINKGRIGIRYHSKLNVKGNIIIGENVIYENTSSDSEAIVGGDLTYTSLYNMGNNNTEWTVSGNLIQKDGVGKVNFVTLRMNTKGSSIIMPNGNIKKLILMGSKEEFIITPDDCYTTLEEIKPVEISLAGGYEKVIDLSDETVGGTAATDRQGIEVKITPPDAIGDSTRIQVYADNAGIIDIAQNTASLDFSNGWNGKDKLAVNVGTNMETYRLDKFAVGKVTGKAGVVTLSIDANGNLADTITVYVNGEYTGADSKKHYMYRGEDKTNYSASVNGEIHYYDTDGILVSNGLFYLDKENKYILIKDSVRVTAKGEAVVEGRTWFIDEEGYVVAGGIYNINGIDRLFTKEGEIVTYAMATADRDTDADGRNYGIYVDENGSRWVIYENGEAKQDDILYDPVVNWTTKWPSEWSKTSGTLPVMKYTVTYRSKNNNGKTAESKEFIATVTSDPTDTASATEIKFIATADLKLYRTSAEGTEAVIPAKANKGIFESGKYIFKDGGTTGTLGGNYNFDDGAKEDGTLTAVFASGENTYTYTGEKIMPEIIVTNGDRTLVKGVDYTVSYSKNKNVGPAMATIKGAGVYTNMYELPFTITAVDMASRDIEFGGLVVKSGTQAAKIDPVITYGGMTLKLKKDYTLSVKSQDSESVTLKVKGIGNFTKETDVTIKYAASPTKIKVTSIRLPAAACYNGEPWTIDKNDVTIDGMASGEEVHLTYSDNINAGTCAVTITADRHLGSVTKKFKIAPSAAAIKVDNEDMLKKVPFDPAGSKPYVKLVVNDSSAVYSNLNGYELVPGKDYKVKYNKNKAMGQGSASITFLGNFAKNNSFKADRNAVGFTIVPVKLDDTSNKVELQMPETVTIGKKCLAGEIFLKTGKNLNVTINGVTMDPKMYTASFTKEGDEINKNTKVAVGDKIGIKISPSGKAGTANYGTAGYTFTETYEIVAAGTYDLTRAKVQILNAQGENASIGYTGTDIRLATDPAKVTDGTNQAYIKISVGNTVLTKEQLERLNIIYANNTAVGTAAVIISADSSDTELSGSIATSFKIGKHSFRQSELK